MTVEVFVLVAGVVLTVAGTAAMLATRSGFLFPVAVSGVALIVTAAVVGLLPYGDAEETTIDAPSVPPTHPETFEECVRQAVDAYGSHHIIVEAVQGGFVMQAEIAICDRQFPEGGLP